MLRIFVLSLCLWVGWCYEGSFLGCYKDLSRIKKIAFDTRPTNECIRECYRRFYRYAFTHPQENCVCGNYLGEEITNSTCKDCSSEICGSTLNAFDAYATGNLVPGPPRNFRITNVTDRSLKLSWDQPESFLEITKYQVKALVLHTYSSFPPNSPEWMYSNNTNQAELITLLPATRYNITLSTKSSDGDGAVVFQIIQTQIADPDPLPEKPRIENDDGSEITIRLYPAQNNNGPISAYRIIVMNSDAKQGFERDSLGSYYEAARNGLAYYIAAELNPEDIEKNFVVGDGKTYGKYYNAPLDSDVKYNIIVALVSRLNGTEKVAFSDPRVTGNGILFLDVGEDSEDSPAVIIGLSIAIGLFTFMLIAGIIGFIILKSRVVNRRQRLSDNQELTLQGPMIEVENNGYIHEEDRAPVNHYRDLKQKVHIIPSSQLKVEPTNFLGIGKFGRVNSGSLQENDASIPIAAYNIQDKKMPRETRKIMLQDLDVLIKVGKHENLVGLLGTCENSQMVTVVLEYASMNLKDLLLASREALPGRFSCMSESQAIDISVQICNGMAHLESHKVMHKQLCARSVMIAAGSTPKISSYGIAQYFNHNKIPDYTRWTAQEVFKNQSYNPKSDVWSFACVLWEIVTLGGTPYGNVSDNNEIPGSITRGLRLPQLPYMSEELYQIMLDCWQVDCDERPTFVDLIESLENLKSDCVMPLLNFNLFPNFQYEQFYPDMELSVRPAF